MRHFVVVEPEVMAEFVNHGLAHLVDRLVPRAGDATDRPAEDGDLVGQQRCVVRAVGERYAAVDA